MWTETKKLTDFLSLSVHYIDADWVVQKHLLGLEVFDEKKKKTQKTSEKNVMKYW